MQKLLPLAKRYRVILGLTLLAAGFCLWLAIGLSGWIDVKYAGPSKIRTAPDGRLALVAGGTLYRLDTDGKPISGRDLADFGLADILSDLILLPDGAFLAAQAEPPAVRLCRESASACTELLGAKEFLGVEAAALFVAWNPHTRRLAVADNFEHRLLLLDETGRLLDISSGKRLPLSFPNRMEWVGDAELAVVDTSHARLIGLRIDNDRFGDIVWNRSTASVSNAAIAPALPPKAMARAGGGDWWTLNGSAEQGIRALSVLPADGGKARAIGLERGADIVDIAWADGRLLLADRGEWRIRALDAAGNRLPDFGDATLRAALDAGRSRQGWLRLAQRAGQFGVAILLGLSIWLAAKITRLEEDARAGEPKDSASEAPATGASGATLSLVLPNDYPYYLDSYRATLSRSWRRILITPLWVAIAWGASLDLYNYRPLGLLSLEGGARLVLWIAFILLCLRQTPEFGALLAMRERARGMAGAARWTVSSQGMACTVGETLHAELAWSGVYAVERLPEGFLVWQSAKAVVWFPLARFQSPADAESFASWAWAGATRRHVGGGANWPQWISTSIFAPMLLPLLPALAELRTPATLPAFYDPDIGTLTVSLAMGAFGIVWNALAGLPTYWLLARRAPYAWSFALAGLALGAGMHFAYADWIGFSPVAPPPPLLASICAYLPVAWLHWLTLAHNRPGRIVRRAEMDRHSDGSDRSERRSGL